MRAIVLSNINMDPIKAVLTPWRVILTKYNDALLQLVDPTSSAAASDIQLVLCHMDGDELLGQQIYGEGEGAQGAYLSALDAFCSRHREKLVLINTIVLSPVRTTNYADVLVTESLRQAELEVNEALVALSRHHENLAVLDLDAIYRSYGSDHLIKLNYWYYGRIKYSHLMFRLLAQHYKGLLDGLLNRSKKVLVLDLDNTLWQGVIGEDGVSGIELSEDGIGKCYRDFQRAVRALKRDGVLLAVNSKNNDRDVEEVFSNHPMMVLTLDDFVATRINWRDKASNIVEIAQELNLGLDSLVFIDDSPVERQLMADHLPDVVVPGFPERPEQLVTWFLSQVVYPYFPRYRMTAEDRRKTEQYKANAQRRQAQQKHEDLDLAAFIDSLGIELDFLCDDPLHVERASQLSQKTNQFNVTTHRYSATQIRAFVDSPKHRVVLLRYKDKFGDEGIVGMALLDLQEGLVDSFLMSCRIIGRRVEGDFLSEVERHLREMRHGVAKSCFVPTPRNQPAASFFEEYGYSVVEQHEDGSKSFKKVLK